MVITLLEEYKNNYFDIYQIEAGVFAVITNTKFRAYAGSNCLIVNLGKRTVVFDTMLYLKTARILFLAAKELTGNTEIIVVNSHWHWDHIRGNQLFENDHSLFISTDKTRKKMITRNDIDIQRHKREFLENINYIEARMNSHENKDDKIYDSLKSYHQLFIELREELSDIEITIPNITFDSKMTIYGERFTVELITFGGAHTVSDVILYIPEKKILHTGDLITNGYGYYIEDGFPDKWLDILDKIKSLEIEVIIPGHGEMGGFELINEATRYFQTLEIYTTKAIDQNLTDEKILNMHIMEEDFLTNYPNFKENIILYMNYLKNNV